MIISSVADATSNFRVISNHKLVVLRSSEK